MNDTLTIAAFSIGGLFMPLLCAALAIKKGRSAGRWFTFGCLGVYFVALVGSIGVLLILSFLPAGTESRESQKLLGLTVTPNSLLIAAAVLLVVFVIGCVGMASAVMTILSALQF